MTPKWTKIDEQAVDDLVVIARREGVVAFGHGGVNKVRGECSRKAHHFRTTWNLKVVMDGNERENSHLNGFIK